MNRVSTSDMVSLATRKAEIELMRSKTQASIDRVRNRLFGLADVFKSVTGENIEPESDRDLLSDLVSAHESERV